MVAPNLPLEGETKGSTQLVGPTKNLKISDSLKRKRNKSKDEEVDVPLHKTHGKCVDCKHLNNPFAHNVEEEEDDKELTEEAYATLTESFPTADEPKNLKQAMESSEWKEWDHVVKSKMDQLQKMGTWNLVEKPTDTIPISNRWNRWVFIKKYNKSGDLLKYKGRLVAKGCSQRPRHDYQETYSLVVHMETLHVILVIAVIKSYSILQMDVKGAYLNSSLKEKVYMTQPEGHNDGTSHVCLLIKTLYRLKQSGREWNIELDGKLKKYGFIRLKSNLCVYTQCNAENIAILTVWVDNLMLFASSDEILKSVKIQLSAEWEITDLGEPAKIIGIEITRILDGIKISQEKYIDSILNKRGWRAPIPSQCQWTQMTNSNPILTAMRAAKATHTQDC